MLTLIHNNALERNLSLISYIDLSQSSPIVVPWVVVSLAWDSCFELWIVDFEGKLMSCWWAKGGRVALWVVSSWWRRGVSNRGEWGGESKSFWRTLFGSYACDESVAASAASGRGGRAAGYANVASWYASKVLDRSELIRGASVGVSEGES